MIVSAQPSNAAQDGGTDSVTNSRSVNRRGAHFHFPLGGDVDKTDTYSANVRSSAQQLRYSTKDPSLDISHGPIVSRSCTDIPCIGILFVAWLVFITISFWGLSQGDPSKLYAPRDFSGSFCGLPKDRQREANADFEDFPLHSYMMNVSGVTDTIAKELICSSAAENALQALLSPAEMSDYMCDCCKMPCASCIGVLEVTDHSSVVELSASVFSRMADLTNPARALQLFSVGGANAGVFNDVFGSVHKFFVETCVKKCDHTGYTNGSLETRTYTYRPDADLPWQKAWQRVVRDERPEIATLHKMVTEGFTFQALPRSECPYDARYCIPFPGISFGQAETGYCNFEVAADVASVMGSGLDVIGLGEMDEQAQHSMGSAMGDVIQTLDVFVIVSVAALVYGFICMVLLRFFVKPAIWAFVLGVALMLSGGAIAAFVLSDRCNGDTLVNAGRTYASSVASSAWTKAKGGSFEQEKMSSAGADYRGMQTMTRTGRSCQRWDAQSPHTHATANASYFEDDLRENYCRNPNGTALTIWCFTTDPSTRWELCEPLGVSPLERTCPMGYAIADERVRTALKVLACIVGVLALAWLCFVCCMWIRIRLAIALYEAAAQFVYNTPLIICVPALSTLVTLCWFAFWAFSAASLVSQVPSEYAPEGFFTWEEAMGTSPEEPGKCNSMWPSGMAWKYAGDEASASDPCSGNMGDTTDIEPRCWKCALPRYNFDTKFAISFFTLLWNNELIIAIGICVIAGSAAGWFFSSPDSSEGGGRGKDYVRVACWNTFRYHIGSLAMGAAIIAIVQFIRYMVMYLEKQLKGAQNRVLTLLFKCTQCCLWCFEGCLRYINKNAYIQTAILGKSFCHSARAAFFLVARNVVRFVVLGFFGSVLRFLGLAFIVVATALTGFTLLELLDPQTSPIVPMVLFTMFAYTVGNSFMNVFALSADTMMQCLIASEEMGLPDQHIPQKFVSLRMQGDDLIANDPDMQKEVRRKVTEMSVPMPEGQEDADAAAKAQASKVSDSE